MPFFRADMPGEWPSYDDEQALAKAQKSMTAIRDTHLVWKVMQCALRKPKLSRRQNVSKRLSSVSARRMTSLRKGTSLKDRSISNLVRTDSANTDTFISECDFASTASCTFEGSRRSTTSAPSWMVPDSPAFDHGMASQRSTVYEDKSAVEDAGSNGGNLTREPGRLSMSPQKVRVNCLPSPGALFSRRHTDTSARHSRKPAEQIPVEMRRTKTEARQAKERPPPARGGVGRKVVNGLRVMTRTRSIDWKSRDTTSPSLSESAIAASLRALNLCRGKMDDCHANAESWQMATENRDIMPSHAIIS